MAGLQRGWKRNSRAMEVGVAGVIEMSSYGDIIKQGRKDTVGKEVNTENSKTVNTESSKLDNQPASPDGEKAVNITIKVPRKSRQYWTSQCKLEGVTMTEVLVEALIERFGAPE